jgi:hypothetical protein
MTDNEDKTKPANPRPSGFWFAAEPQEQPSDVNGAPDEGARGRQTKRYFGLRSTSSISRSYE